MSKILHRLMVVFACVSGFFVQPCGAEPDLSDYVLLSLFQWWNGKPVRSAPTEIYMHKTTRSLYVLNDSLTELVPFYRLTQLPTVSSAKFKGFYAAENVAGIQEIIDKYGYPVSEGINALLIRPSTLRPAIDNTGIREPEDDNPMGDNTDDEIIDTGDVNPVSPADEGLGTPIGNINLYPDFDKVLRVVLDPNGGEGGTQFMYYLTGSECGIWKDSYMNEPLTESSFVIPTHKDGLVFEGYYDTLNGGIKWIDETGNLSGTRQMVCNSDEYITRLYARWSQCGVGLYESSGSCVSCPRNPNSSLYDFIKVDGTGIETCALKLNVLKSKCAIGTDVVYRYDGTKYVLDGSSTIITGEDMFVTNIDNDVSKDFCGPCLFGKGQYANNERRCFNCPTEDYPNIINGLYKFFLYGDGLGKESCAVRLDTAQSTCGDGTYVEYVFDPLNNYYVRTPGYVIKEYKAPVKTGAAFPTEIDVVDYCAIECSGDKYVLDGECAYCSNGYYLKDGKCEKCPAGYACKKADGNISSAVACGKDQFAEEGSAECTKCADGYTTRYSGPRTTEGYGYDGLCKQRQGFAGAGGSRGYGVQCVSANACQAIRDVTVCLGPGNNCDDTYAFGDIGIDTINKILSINKSVIKQ